MVNRGEEKVRVHMNVVPRSTGNTNSGTRELTLNLHFRVNSLVPLFVFPVLRGTTFILSRYLSFRICGPLLFYLWLLIHNN